VIWLSVKNVKSTLSHYRIVSRVFMDKGINYFKYYYFNYLSKRHYFLRSPLLVIIILKKRVMQFWPGNEVPNLILAESNVLFFKTADFLKKVR